jgi:catechol 2,3-dioxygenase-like lactoylglutathione lyase family enzyme
MQVQGLVWLGIHTSAYDRMVHFLTRVLGMRVQFEEEETSELSFPNGTRIQVFAPGHPYYSFFESHSAGPVALFEVDDVHAAETELRRAGINVIGSVDSDESWSWVNFRGPDGNLYEIASQRREQR